MKKIEDWPLWLQLLVVIPHIPVLVWLLIRDPKTRKRPYFAFGFMVYMVIFYFLFMK
jgi:hypothetical protein